MFASSAIPSLILICLHNQIGILAVKRVNGIPTVFPAEVGHVSAEENLLQVVYDNGPVEDYSWDTFDVVRTRVATEWQALPKVAGVISCPLKNKMEATRRKQEALNR